MAESQEAYIPVAVTFDEKGKVTEAVVDFEGAPWMFTDKEANVWLVSDDDPDGCWVRSDIEFDAIDWLNEVLGSALADAENVTDAAKDAASDPYAPDLVTEDQERGM